MRRLFGPCTRPLRKHVEIYYAPLSQASRARPQCLPPLGITLIRRAERVPAGLPATSRAAGHLSSDRIALSSDARSDRLRSNTGEDTVEFLPQEATSRRVTRVVGAGAALYASFLTRKQARSMIRGKF